MMELIHVLRVTECASPRHCQGCHRLGRYFLVLLQDGGACLVLHDRVGLAGRRRVLLLDVYQ